MSNEFLRFRTQSRIKDADFLKVLNANYSRATEEKYADFLEALNAECWYRSPPDPDPWHLSFPTPLEQPLQPALISRILRQFVDTWLDSGRNPDGSESPLNRKLTEPLSLAVRNYLDKFSPFHPHLSERGIEIQISQPVDLRCVHLLGAQAVSACVLFVGMLASDWKDRICKCRDPRCGVYFIAKKVRHSTSVTFCCREHAKRTSAAECMRANRSGGKAALIDAAAQYLSDRRYGPDWVAKTSVKDRVVKLLCTLLRNQPRLRAYRHQVARNWVTWHQDAIEQRRLETRAAACE